MANFDIDPQFADQLDWVRAFVADEIEPLDVLLGSEEVIYDKSHPVHADVIRPLQKRVRDHGMWSCHLTPEMGGQGYGQVRLAYLNEILGRSSFAPSIFGCQAPDSGNAEILAHYGTPAQRDEFLQPLARRTGVVVLLDDRTPGRGRPVAAHHPRPSATGTSGSSTARSGSRRASNEPRSSS